MSDLEWCSRCESRHTKEFGEQFHDRRSKESESLRLALMRKERSAFCPKCGQMPYDGHDMCSGVWRRSVEISIPKHPRFVSWGARLLKGEKEFYLYVRMPWRRWMYMINNDNEGWYRPMWTVYWSRQFGVFKLRIGWVATS